MHQKPERAAAEIVKVARRHFVTLHSVHQSRKDFGFTIYGFRRQRHGSVAIKELRVPGNGFVERGAPFRQTTLLREETLIFIRDIVDEAHESIKSSQGVALRLRQDRKSTRLNSSHQ